MKEEGKEFREIPEDEIDLYELWLKLKRRWKFIFIFVALSAIASAVYLSVARQIYFSSFLIKVPQVISPAEAKAYVEILNGFLKEERYEDLVRTLNIGDDIIYKIHKISSKEVRRAKQTLEVKIEVYDPAIINDLSIAILTYLNRNQLVQERLKIKREEIKENIENLKRRIKALEETRDLINRVAIKGGSIYFNPAELDEITKTFHDQLTSLKAQLALLKGFEISVHPVIPQYPSKPKKVLIISAVLITSIFASVFIALFIEWVQHSRRQYEIESK